VRAGESVFEIGESVFGIEADLGFGVAGSFEITGADDVFGEGLGEENGLVESPFGESGAGDGDWDDDIVGVGEMFVSVGFEDVAERFGEGGDSVELEAFDRFVGTGFVEVGGVDAFQRGWCGEVGCGGSKFGFARVAESPGAKFATESAFGWVEDIEKGL
jgi:hypothetical protein